MDSSNTERRRWTEEETTLALFLYFQLPFGKLHAGNPEIRQLASAIGRTHSSVAMKLCNFASLDPQITGSGRKGLDGASKLDRALYARFTHSWSQLVTEGEDLWADRVFKSRAAAAPAFVQLERKAFNYEPFKGVTSEVQAVVNQRVGQGFFRRAVMANYEEACCITGIAEPQVLVASHIKPWAVDEANRHNPSNGLLLSATMDKAFDQGLLTVTASGNVKVAQRLLDHPSAQTRSFFSAYDGGKVQAATRFCADPELLDWHNRVRFEDKHLFP
jgi:putative restriction endonuclease